MKWNSVKKKEEVSMKMNMKNNSLLLSKYCTRPAKNIDIFILLKILLFEFLQIAQKLSAKFLILVTSYLCREVKNISEKKKLSNF